MAHAYVKYLCDDRDDRFTVPITFIKDFIKKDFEAGKKYEVFWSPDPKQTPRDVERFQGKIAVISKLPELKKGKSKEPLAGYYDAEVLMIADTKKKLEEALEDKRVSAPSIKKSESLEPQNKKYSRTKKGNAKGSCSKTDYVSKAKENKLIEEGIKSTVTLLDRKYSTRTFSESASSGDEVILKSEVDELRAKIKKQKTKIKELKETVKARDTRIEKLENYNLTLLKSKQVNKANSEPPPKKAKLLPEVVKKSLFPENNSEEAALEHSNSVEVIEDLDLVEVDDLKSGADELSGENLFEETPSAFRSTSTQESCDDSDSALNDETLSSLLEPTEPKGQSTPLKKQKPQTLLLSLTDKQWTTVNRGLSNSHKGDSKYVKHLASLVFGIPRLLKSSLSGKASNQSGIEYPALPTEGVDFIHESLSKRLNALRCTETEKQMRLDRLGGYITAKINDLRRAPKKKAASAAKRASAKIPKMSLKTPEKSPKKSSPKKSSPKKSPQKKSQSQIKRTPNKGSPKKNRAPIG